MAVFLPVLGDVLYRNAVRRQASDLHDRLLYSHRRWDRVPPQFARFGVSTDTPEPSLIRDLGAWTSRKLEWNSDLDHDIRGSAHAYLRISFESQRGADKEEHSFIWSPGRLRFVAWDSGTGCRQAGCPWLPGPAEK
jgi:hypothetical protein